jgi:hypothetical protein
MRADSDGPGVLIRAGIQGIGTLEPSKGNGRCISVLRSKVSFSPVMYPACS